MKTILIIGSGPAGLSAAFAVAEGGVVPILLERMTQPSMKLLASGGGRCNFSNELPQEDFMDKFGREGAFMRNALNFAPKEWLLKFLRGHGVPTELTDHFFWFPASGKASDIQQCFLRCSHADVRCHCEVKKICTEEKHVTGVELQSGESLPADAVILAAGGCAWKGLGTHAGLNLAKALGHTIHQPLPAVAPLLIKAEWIRSLAGVTLPKASLSLRSGKKNLHTSGSIVFTHNGLSGFPALDLAGECAALCRENGTAELKINFYSDFQIPDWQKLLKKARSQTGNKTVKGFLSEFLPRSLAGILAELAGCPETKLCQMPATAELKLPVLLAEHPVTLLGAGPMDCAMAMRGGVSLKEVDPATMESRLVSGLFLAGEILNLTGPCGGYNIQWAISSGRLAGYAAIQSLDEV